MIVLVEGRDLLPWPEKKRSQHSGYVFDCPTHASVLVR